jgi:ADP-ribose pyrophosphatase YjhB (NUDIX family)
MTAPTPFVVGLLRIEGRKQDTHVMCSTPHFSDLLGLPGGYIPSGKTAEQAISDIVLEFTEFEVRAQHWRPLTTRITPDNTLVIYMRSYIAVCGQHLKWFSGSPGVKKLQLVPLTEMLTTPVITREWSRQLVWA